VLEIAQCLRRKGFTTARDIIRRDFDNSLAYAKRTNILRMMVIGGEYCGDDEVYVVRVADGTGITIKKSELFRDDFVLNIES
jgi:ATP phosphoribosyltransferase regulatory subunit